MCILVFILVWPCMSALIFGGTRSCEPRPCHLFSGEALTNMCSIWLQGSYPKAGRNTKQYVIIRLHIQINKKHNIDNATLVTIPVSQGGFPVTSNHQPHPPNAKVQSANVGSSSKNKAWQSKEHHLIRQMKLSANCERESEWNFYWNAMQIKTTRYRIISKAAGTT